MTLWSNVLNHDRRLIHKWKHYFPIYERHFKEYVYKSVTFIEIGCGPGGSLQMWKQYFGPHARIIGVDINPGCRRFAEDQIEIHIGAQQDTAFLQRLVEAVGTPDIVVDDGSHVMSDIVATFNFFYPKMPKNGVYLVEDLHTAYWEEYEGGLRKPTTFIETCKGLIDELNADHSRGALPSTEFTKSTVGMHFYDSVVVFERGAYTGKCAPMWGGRLELIAERAKAKLGRGYCSPVVPTPKS
ncbi:MAG: class I SAM-dependent methyltransferase [Acidobacteria bacterium]|nr:class I SAM-dependent methyltransferase [Acidobacteriota bacterium]MBV9626452.1 class I SAM-dependent methyltransferase [Acidobacteriota bacterium]